MNCSKSRSSSSTGAHSVRKPRAGKGLACCKTLGKKLGARPTTALSRIAAPAGSDAFAATPATSPRCTSTAADAFASQQPRPAPSAPRSRATPTHR